MHRDLKLANLLLNLPEYQYDLGIKSTTKAQRKLAKDEHLKSLDITVPGRILVKIADLGFAQKLNYEDLSETMCSNIALTMIAASIT
jgi:serine/threonine protein kinase